MIDYVETVSTNAYRYVDGLLISKTFYDESNSQVRQMTRTYYQLTSITLSFKSHCQLRRGVLFTFSGYLGDGSQRNYATALTYSSLGGMKKRWEILWWAWQRWWWKPEVRRPSNRFRRYCLLWLDRSWEIIPRESGPTSALRHYRRDFYYFTGLFIIDGCATLKRLASRIKKAESLKSQLTSFSQNADW